MAALLPAEPRYRNSLGMELVRIEPGSFTMGHEGRPLREELLRPVEADGVCHVWLPPDGDYDEHPAHEVAISRPFYLGVCQVTNEQYEQFDRLHAYQRGKYGFSIDNDEAVIFVTWHEAQAFCQWLAEREGLPYRLPTEAEWEYACRAGTTTFFSTGDALPLAYLANPGTSWYPSGRGRGRADVPPLHVGRTPANPWGLHDMHGNVEEWCLDWYGPYEPGRQVDPVGRASGDFKVTRGGSHSTVAYYLRSANRLGTLPEDCSWHIGLRVAIGELPATRPLPAVPPPPVQVGVRQRRPKAADQAPDPSRPYFAGPIPYVVIAEGSRGPLFSHHNHDAAIAECPNGDVFAIWYTTHTERGREVAVAASRLRAGQEAWEPASPFWDAPDRNDHCPGLWCDGRTLYHLNSLSTAATWGPLAIIMRTSADSGATWSPARLVLPEHVSRHMVIPGIFQAADGTIVMACDAATGSGNGTALQLSRDGGQTWADPGGTIAGIHAGVAQLGDGRLLALGRGDNIDGRMPMSLSADMGRTWAYRPSPFPPIGGGQRLVLLRLREGPLLLVSFADEPLPTTDAAGRPLAITGMFTALSDDDGETWEHVRPVSDGGPAHEERTLDGRPYTMSPTNGEPKGYLAACQGKNGVIHLISSLNHYRFNLAWLETPPPGG